MEVCGCPVTSSSSTAPDLDTLVAVLSAMLCASVASVVPSKRGYRGRSGRLPGRGALQQVRFCRGTADDLQIHLLDLRHRHEDPMAQKVSLKDNAMKRLSRFAFLTGCARILIANSCDRLAATPADLDTNRSDSRMVQGFEATGTSLPCCSISDCRAQVDSKISDDGRYEVMVDGTWYRVRTGFVLLAKATPSAGPLLAIRRIFGYGTLRGNGAYDVSINRNSVFCAGATDLITAAAQSSRSIGNGACKSPSVCFSRQLSHCTGPNVGQIRR